MRAAEVGLQRFEARVQLAAPPAAVFAWHEQPGAFEALAPPGEPIQVLERQGGIADGDWVRVSLPLFPRGPLRMTWRAVHHDFVRGQQFADRAEGGPFAVWEHLHRFEPDERGGTWMIDRVDWRLPGPALLSRLAAPVVRARLAALFAYRHSVLRATFGFTA